ncbi:aminotransferase class III-fold pyridoxal phosphate-dependent enzyme [Solirubrobacter phytolaccae]|uniref:Aminotransferase class III-fold pyridoxal phosphate-dependent enzyme n=1 Tax=Solirubrobacter phytolaccae TaxID=1404360 RepID=A0A9X3N540_9ACTN|nr:aminotransferase class III-fold pyridoxal phosphate-dependent enzyme [Solirubrobacter phytolaccae]MDA0179848.1 aminotransferase class III-fold pyridoxal phosphate-dependent enzyme [Solirubrobacter phytolaccae]
MDRVLTGATPNLTTEDAVEIAATRFGVRARTAKDLGSERDRTFRLEADGPVAILKVSNAAEDPDVLDMEAAAALHVTAVDPGLSVALPQHPGDDATQLRARWREHWVRLYDVLPGSSRIAATDLSDAALAHWGETTARLGQALRGFTHPKAVRVMPWDVQHALRARAMLGDVRDPRARATVERVLDAFEERATPRWPLLRAQVAHTDLTVDNALTDDAGLITGIIDFGDMSHTALVTDLASVLDSVCGGREGDELLRAARLVLDGYQRRVPLEDIELEVLGVAWAARAALTIAISSWRVAQGLEDQAWAERYNALALGAIETLETTGWDAVTRALGGEGARAPDPSLQPRRAQAFGPAVDPLFYAEPIEVLRAEGVWITDTAGRTYLDAYNNVPCVGHAHPRVTTAIARQSRRINTHTRYLHPNAIELSERLIATCPPELDTVLLVNSGSEANDLAWRMATAVTGNRGGLCTDFAYHGITEAIAALSPEGWFGAPGPDHVATWAPHEALDAAIETLHARGHAPAAAILDGVVTSDGIHDLDPAHVRGLVQRTRASGGLWIADEVQSGHGRTGSHLWCFERFGIVPDFVTLGKPMGNGHPVAAVITRSEIVAQLVGRTTLFSTFGGNPVSAAAALAVLDVLEDERVLDRVQRTSKALLDALEVIDHPAIAEVRGVGLAVAVELDTEARAKAVRDEMRRLGVLIGTTGRGGNVLKIRPPLALDEPHVPTLTDALARALASIQGGPRS